MQKLCPANKKRSSHFHSKPLARLGDLKTGNNVTSIPLLYVLGSHEAKKAWFT